jgi:hypothetical protein
MTHTATKTNPSIGMVQGQISWYYELTNGLKLRIMVREDGRIEERAFSESRGKWSAPAYGKARQPFFKETMKWIESEVSK